MTSTRLSTKQQRLEEHSILNVLSNTVLCVDLNNGNQERRRNYIESEDEPVNIPQPVCVQGFPESFTIKIVIKLNCQFLIISCKRAESFPK